MPDYKVQKASSASSEWDSHSANMLADLKLNPGTTAAALATRLVLPQDTTDRVLASMDRAGVVYRGYDAIGAEFLWDVADFGSSVMGSLGAARTWLVTHDGGMVSEMATDLSVHHAVATKIAFTLQAEADVKLTAV